MIELGPKNSFLRFLDPYYDVIMIFGGPKFFSKKSSEKIRGVCKILGKSLEPFLTDPDSLNFGQNLSKPPGDAHMRTHPQSS